ncbi:putative hydroxymethylpyrimidine transporter CytX [Peribacillus psychrosaccharolyticus]|uniref:putative hydroxymethylpyrimidine transporter CytX n=1 Tax=Peribacillus psychrosaccharolyticus TaxID=1407 RepID=UPI003D2E97FD
MSGKRTSLSQFSLWFGAAVSIAEMLTGALIAPLGFKNGMAAILIGHVIGGFILFMAGSIGAKSKLSSIESTRISFGTYGSYLFSLLNIIQLLGWTAVMIIGGAKTLNVVTIQLFGMNNEVVWSILIGFLIIIWISLGMKNVSYVNGIAVGILFIFTIILGVTVFSNELIPVGEMTGKMTFGTAVELNVAMALSWLPLIADYTKHVEKEKSGTFYSVLGYFIGSILMFVIGLGASLYVGTTDIASILLSAGLGGVALFIVLFATITTTFLDVYSAGISFQNISHRISEKNAGILVCILGVVLAVFVPITQYEHFLYLIGSVFAPLFAILLTEYFIFKKTSINKGTLINLSNIVIWVLGVIGYRLFLPIGSVAGVTLPIMIATGLVTIILNGGRKVWKKKF